jgi:drug/metabolite transporter (DMT)-like permease
VTDFQPLAGGVLFGLVAMVGWGLGDVSGALLSRRLENLRALLWVTAAGLALLALFVSVTGTPVTWRPAALPAIVLAGALNTAGAVCFMRGLRVGTVSLVSAIASAYAVVLVLAALVLLGERLTAAQGLAVALVLAGSLLAASDLAAWRRGGRPGWSDPGLPFAFGAMFAWGLGYLALAQAARATGWVATSGVAAGVEIVTLALVAVGAGRSIAPPVGRRLVGLTGLTALFSWTANVAYTAGVETNLAAIVAPISAAFPVVTLVLARLLLHERLRPWQWAGIALVIVGVVLLSLATT